MVKEKKSYGLTLKKLDLHIHTPASLCFQGTTTPDEIVNYAISKGLDGIAITDHNSAEMIDAVLAASKNKPLVVFPGVEITCSGGKQSIHIIALFDITENSKKVIALLNNLKIYDDSYGKQDTVTNKNPIEVIDEIYESGGLPILAHANSSNGVLHDMSGQPRTNVIQNNKLMAAESTDFNDDGKKNKRTRTVDFLDGSDPTYQRKLAVYQASDNPSADGSGGHSCSGIGSRYSYFKMEKISLDSLRQCFIDPTVRIFQEEDIQARIYPRIKSIKINSGFLSDQEIEFHEGLTSILGAKGTGKSLLIEFLRFALNQEPTNKSIFEDHMSKLKSKLGEYGKVEVVVIDENNSITTIARTFYSIDNSPYDETISIDPAQLFPVLFLSQNEIIKIAEEEDEQLKFIDRFFDFRAYRMRIASIEHELEFLDKEMVGSLNAFHEFSELQGRITSIERDIQKLDEAFTNPIFDRYKKLKEKEKILKLHHEYLNNRIIAISTIRDNLNQQGMPVIPDYLKKDPSLLRTKDFIKKANEIIETQFEALISGLKEDQKLAKKEFEGWFPQLSQSEEEYQKYLRESGGDQKAIALRREKLVAELSDLQRKQRIAKSKKDNAQEISRRRNELLDGLQDQYEEYSKERQSKCEKFQKDSNGKLKLRILGSSNVEEFRTSLLTLKRGSYLKDDEIVKITSKINPREFVMALLRYDVDKQSKFLQKVAEESEIELARMKTLADFLLTAIEYDQLLSLQYKALPQDRPEILYDNGNGNFECLANVSVGQKCNALLIMALSDGTMPIVIDQPEDSLDIRSIWDDMCSKLRYGKNRRQFIFTTHNSSLAVASDTDCYLVLEGNAQNGKVIHAGSMDHEPVSGEVLKYLEGGSETYELKYQKYKVRTN
jgi:ABC-type lipoprotein export system ATPase subunit